MWNDAENGRNSYVPVEVHWVRFKGVKMETETIKNTSEQQFNVEFECEFLGRKYPHTPSKLKAFT